MAIGAPIGSPIGGGSTESVVLEDYVPNFGVAFDGTNDFLGGVPTTGLSGSQITFSFWFKPNTGGGRYIAQIRGGGIFCIINGTDPTIQVRFGAENLPTTGNAFDFYSFSTVTAGEWHHFIASADVSAGVGKLYIDGGNALDSTHPNHTLNSGEAINWADSVGLSVGARNASLTDPYDGALQEVWLSQEYVDLGVQANREKFLLDGKPVSLGDDGSTPTGTQSIVYLKNDYLSFEQNLGSLANFPVTGALGNEGTRPFLSTATITYALMADLDALVQKTYSRATSINAVLTRQTDLTVSLDSRLLKTYALTCGIDTYISTPLSVSCQIDADLIPAAASRFTISCSLDGFVISGVTMGEVTFSMDAVLRPSWGRVEEAMSVIWAAVNNFGDQ